MDTITPEWALRRNLRLLYGNIKKSASYEIPGAAERRSSALGYLC